MEASNTYLILPQFLIVGPLGDSNFLRDHVMITPKFKFNDIISTNTPIFFLVYKSFYSLMRDTFGNSSNFYFPF